MHNPMARIMIADDSPDNRMMFRDLMEMNNHEIIAELKNGLNVVEKFFQYNPDILLLDLAMPQKDGMVILHEIKDKAPDADIIVISASDSEKIITRCLKNGATAFIPKPFEIDELSNAISDILTCRRRSIGLSS